MSQPRTPTGGGPHRDWTDQQLIEACVSGDETAWEALIQRHKALIYSFARRYGAQPSDASDVFQLVCAELFVALPRLRNHLSLRAWIMTVASHQAYHWKRRHIKRLQRETAEPTDAVGTDILPPSAALEQYERERLVREAVEQLSDRDRLLVKLLFFQDPPLPYEAIASEIGLAIGSIGLTRARCLKKLERILEKSGGV